MDKLNKDYWAGWIHCYLRELQCNNPEFKEACNLLKIVILEDKIVLHYAVEVYGHTYHIVCDDPKHIESTTDYREDIEVVNINKNKLMFIGDLEDALIKISQINPFYAE